MKNPIVQDTVVYNKETDEVVVRKKRNGTLRTPFSAIGPLTNKEKRTMAPDVFDRLDQVSKAAFTVFNNLKYNRAVQNNLTKYVPEDGSLSKTQKETLSRKLKELKDVDIIRQTKREMIDPDGVRVIRFPKGTFIINPELIRCLDHNEAESLWKQCEGDSDVPL